MKVEVKIVVSNGGYNQNANGKVGLTLSSKYSELSDVVQLTQMLNQNTKLEATVPGSKPMVIGEMLLDFIGINHDGTSKIKFKGLSDFVDMDVLHMLPFTTDDVPEFSVVASCDIEEEVDDDDDDWGDDE